MTSKMFYKNHALWLNLLDDDGCVVPVADFMPNSRIGMCATPRDNIIGPKLAELWNQEFQNEDGKDK